MEATEVHCLRGFVFWLQQRVCYLFWDQAEQKQNFGPDTGGARCKERDMPASPELIDDDILLRPFHFEDARQLSQAVHESLNVLSPWMSWATEAYTEATAREYITITKARWEERTLFAFAITCEDEILGGCTLSSLHGVYRYCNLGYWVRCTRHGRGIAGRAAKLAARFAFEKLGLVRVEIVIAVGNHASVRVAEKIGAHYEGVLRNRMVVGRSVYDAHMYSLIPLDFGLVARL